MKKKKLVKKSKKKVAPKKKTAKRKVKQAVKKTSKKAIVKKASARKVVKPIGKVTHFYNHIKVAIVKFNKPVRSGTELQFKGATTDFREVAKSMQFDHVSVAVAPKGKLIGIKVKKRVRDGDLVFEVK